MDHDKLLAGVRWLRDKAGGGSTAEPTAELCAMMANSIERQVAVERQVQADDEDPPMFQHNGHWKPIMAPEMSHADVAGEARMLTHSELAIDKMLKGGKPLDYYCVLVRDRILYLMQRLWAQEVKYQARVTELLAANNVEVERRRAAEAMCQHILSKLKEPPSAYLIWSNEHRLWWRPQSAGYTASLESAGRYSREEAVKICRNARGGWRPGELPPEVPVREADALAALEGPR